MKTVKRQKKQLSIRNSIFISMSVLVLIIMCILWLAQTVLMSSIYSSVKKSETKHAINMVAENIDNPGLSDFADRIALEYEACITVINRTDNTTVCDVHYLNDCILHSYSFIDSQIEKWYEKAKNNGGEYGELISREKRIPKDTEDDNKNDKIPENAPICDCLVCVKIVRAENGSENLIILNASPNLVNGTIKTFRLQLLIVSIVIIIAAVIIANWLSKRISAPISKISKQAKNLTYANYNIQFSGTGSEETVELAKTLNSTVQQLASVEQLQKELIANISHDLRTPLTMISGYAEVMRDIPGENTPENMQVIIDETARLSSLINDMLDLSKLQKGAVPIHLSLINLTDLIRQTLKRYTKLVLKDGYKISFDYDYDVFVEADEIRLLQVIYNLLNNAVNYTGENKFVFVYQNIIGDTVRISIRDTGEGISEEHLPHIWDRYYKVDKVHKRAAVGTGLGLSIVKNILILHGSRFGVSSDVGKGSTFWFEFKIVDNPSLINTKTENHK